MNEEVEIADIKVSKAGWEVTPARKHLGGLWLSQQQAQMLAAKHLSTGTKVLAPD